MTETEIAALCKGLSFVPTASCNDFETHINLHKFFRSLRLTEFFNKPKTTEHDATSTATEADVSTGTTNKNVNKNVFRPKSKFIPYKGRNASLDTYCRLVEKDVQDVLKRKHEYKTHNNMNITERKALKDLQNDATIVIKPADKGGAIVIQSVENYEKEIERQLQDSDFYQKLTKNPSTDFQKSIHGKLQQLLDNDDINKDEHDFMKVMHPRIATMYCLPKIHKSLQNPKGRPIVSCIGSLTSNISSFVDHHLKPSATALDSHIRDSGDFLQKLQDIGPVSDKDLLVTFDVESLYTNIPHEGALEAIEHFLEKRPSENLPRTKCIMDLTAIVLHHNYFLFKDTFYLQRKGCAMGSKMAPQLANIYMGLFENSFIMNPLNPFHQRIKFFKRFLDDLFIIFTGTKDELSSFHDYLNGCNENLRFTMDADPKEINFLDIKVTKVDNVLTTNPYRKPTDC